MYRDTDILTRLTGGGIMDSIPTNGLNAPSAITTFQAAHDRRDVRVALAQFTFDAQVVDDGRTYDGIAAVESFLQHAGSEFTYTRALLEAQEIAPDRWRITNRLEGDFPGGQVDLSYEFELVSGLIRRLTIAP